MRGGDLREPSFSSRRDTATIVVLNLVAYQEKALHFWNRDSHCYSQPQAPGFWRIWRSACQETGTMYSSPQELLTLWQWAGCVPSAQPWLSGCTAWELPPVLCRLSITVRRIIDYYCWSLWISKSFPQVCDL